MQHSQRSQSPADGAGPRREEEAGQGQKRVYLRTTYVLNPGIPHYVDFPVPGR